MIDTLAPLHVQLEPIYDTGPLIMGEPQAVAVLAALIRGAGSPRPTRAGVISSL